MNGARGAAGGKLFTRSATDRVLVGVAGGLGAQVGVDAILVRLAFGVLTVASGLGIVLYLGAWGLSAEPDPAAPEPATREVPRPRQIAAFACIVLGLLLMLRDVGLWFGDTLVWPVALAAAGSALIWARSDERDRARWARVSAHIPGNPVEAVFAGRVSPMRVAAGGVLLAGGIALFLASNSTFAAARIVVLAAAATAAGLGLILGPWIFRLARDASEERRARIRSDERAEIAAHLHDSVLHTLALIQRAEVSPEIVSLARRQERELRSWLNRGAAPPPEQDLRGGVDALASEVERLHNVSVDAVVVGDIPLDERTRALLLAAHEAAVNAARHSGAQRVSVYVEAEPDVVTAFVRDQGGGFDVDAVPPDRRGIAESIVGRMRRYGGTATIVSRAGQGTEVQLTMPRQPA
jgi:signal transduction histidine kinase/phage shock protein PspC (stress-responsive transcriptional regulator)